MLYKTITLHLLQDNPKLYDQLVTSRTLLAALNRYAMELSDLHEAWKSRLRENRPGSDETQLASEALELALSDLQQDLPSESEPDETETFPLDQAMAFISRHTPPA